MITRAPARVRLLFLLALIASPSLCGCTPAQIGAGVVIGREVVHYTCAGARKICEWTGDTNGDACRFLASACEAIGEGAPPAP